MIGLAGIENQIVSESRYRDVPYTHAFIAQNRFNPYCLDNVIDIGSCADIDPNREIGISKYHADCPLILYLYKDEYGQLERISAFHLPADDESINSMILEPLKYSMTTTVQMEQPDLTLVFVNDGFRNPDLSEQKRLALKAELEAYVLEVLEETGNEEVKLVRISTEGYGVHRDQQRIDYIFDSEGISVWSNIDFDRHELATCYGYNDLFL